MSPAVRLACLLACSLAVARRTGAQDTATQDAAAHDTATNDTDEALKKELRALVDASVEPDGPGGILGLLRRGEPFFVQPFGLADLDEKRAVTSATAFYLASVAKNFTAACVLDAAEAGKLELDAPVRKYVTSLPERLGGVTLRQLLHHRSGIDDVYDLVIGLDLGGAPLASNAAAVELCARAAEPDFAPGARFCYSNTGYVLLAEALRSATGSALPAYARAKLFEPLGMTHARYVGEPELAAIPRAKSYDRTDDGWRVEEILTGLVGPGGLWASFDDLARWERGAFEGGWSSAKVRERLLAPPVLAPEQSLHPVFGPYAGGALIGEDHGLPLVRLAGGAFGYGAEILRYPEQELSVVCLYNDDLGIDDLAEKAAAIALREELRDAPARDQKGADEPRGVDPATLDLARFGRFWREEDSGVLWVLTLKPEHMTVVSLGDWKAELVPLGPERLAGRHVRTPIELAFEPPKGPATRMLVRAKGVLVATCRPQPFPPKTAPVLDDYAGEYAFAPLGTKLVLRAEAGGLRIVAEHALRPGPPYELPPFHFLGDDLFVCDAGAQMQFTRDAAGKVAGLRLDLNRARGLVLQRR